MDYNNFNGVKPYSKMTINELKAQIRMKTNQVNADLLSREELKDSFSMNQVVKRLQHIGTKGGTASNGVEIPLGTGLGKKGRTKSSYINQVRELDYAQKILESETGIAELEDKYKQSYDSFIASNPNKLKGITEEEWKSLVNAWGSLGEKVVKDFDSTQIAKLYKQYGDNEIDIESMLRQVLKEHTGKQKTVAENTDRFETLIVEAYNKRHLNDK